MLRKHLMRILSLSSEKMCYDEARKKFNETYMFVNGCLEEVIEVNWSDRTLVTRGRNGGGTKEVKVKELESWLPDSGLYRLNSGQAALVYKKPKRQWLKSFNTNYYSVMNVGNSLDGHQYQSSIEYYDDISKAKRIDIFVDTDKFIWYHKNKIGFVKNSNIIVCTDNRFIQELKDWSRDT